MACTDIMRGAWEKSCGGAGNDGMAARTGAMKAGGLTPGMFKKTKLDASQFAPPASSSEDDMDEGKQAIVDKPGKLGAHHAALAGGMFGAMTTPHNIDVGSLTPDANNVYNVDAAKAVVMLGNMVKSGSRVIIAGKPNTVKMNDCHDVILEMAKVMTGVEVQKSVNCSLKIKNEAEEADAEAVTERTWQVSLNGTENCKVLLDKDSPKQTVTVQNPNSGLEVHAWKLNGQQVKLRLLNHVIHSISSEVKDDTPDLGIKSEVSQDKFPDLTEGLNPDVRIFKENGEIFYQEGTNAALKAGTEKKEHPTGPRFTVPDCKDKKVLVEGLSDKMDHVVIRGELKALMLKDCQEGHVFVRKLTSGEAVKMLNCANLHLLIKRSTGQAVMMDGCDHCFVATYDEFQEFKVHMSQGCGINAATVKTGGKGADGETDHDDKHPSNMVQENTWPVPIEVRYVIYEGKIADYEVIDPRS